MERPKDAPPVPAATPAAGATPVTEAATAAGAEPDQITIDQFARIDLRTARIVKAEPVANADRLLQLTVDTGGSTRTIVAGIAKRYSPDALVGKMIVVVANLKPARLRGVESQGMLLAASDPSGNPYILTTEEAVEPGWKVR